MNSPINTDELIIEAGRAERQYWRDLWKYRELFYFLAWRDILVRYKQTVIGIAWSAIRPLLTTFIFVFIFQRMAKLDSGNVPYPLLVFTGMLPWFFFANALSECSNSLVSNANLISKIYFPRLIVPAGTVITTFVDFVISAVILVVMMTWYQYLPDWRVIFVPLFILVAFAAAMGAGLWLAALTVKYRDFRYIVPFIVQFGFFVSPLGMKSDLVPEQWRFLYSLNPMVGVIDGFRWALLRGASQLYMPGFLLSLGVIAVLLVSGIWYFRKTEKTFADVI